MSEQDAADRIAIAKDLQSGELRFDNQVALAEALSKRMLAQQHIKHCEDLKATVETLSHAIQKEHHATTVAKAGARSDCAPLKRPSL